MPEFDPNLLEEDLDAVEETNFDPVPAGTYVCLLTVSGMEKLGKSEGASWGLRVSARVVEENFNGYVIRDNLFWSTKAMPRIKAALHRLAGIQGGVVTAGQVRNSLNGKLARVTVGKVENRIGNDGKTYSASKVTFSGYAAPSREELEKYGAEAVAVDGSENGDGKKADELPF